MNGFVFSPLFASPSNPAVGPFEQSPIRCGPMVPPTLGAFETLDEATAWAKDHFGDGLKLNVSRAADGGAALVEAIHPDASPFAPAAVLKVADIDPVPSGL